MEIVNINVLLAEPIPFAFERFAWFRGTLVDGATNLEAGLVKVCLNEDGDGLVLLILDIDLLSNQVEYWKLTGFSPRICFEVKHCRLFFFCSTDEKNLSDFVVHLLRRNSWSSHLFWRFTKRLEFGVFSLDDCHSETFLENHGVLERENQILEFGELDDVLRQDITILLHDVLVLVLLVLPKFFEVKDLLNLVDGFVGENVLVVMTPFIFFKINLSDGCSIRKMECVQDGVFHKKMKLHVAAWIEDSRVHDLWNCIIIELLIYLIQLKEVAHRQERGEFNHGHLVARQFLYGCGHL